jgi:hypothetical protein
MVESSTEFILNDGKLKYQRPSTLETRYKWQRCLPLLSLMLVVQRSHPQDSYGFVLRMSTLMDMS